MYMDFNFLVKFMYNCIVYWTFVSVHVDLTVYLHSGCLNDAVSLVFTAKERYFPFAVKPGDKATMEPE